jgi:hypothetical protein
MTQHIEDDLQARLYKSSFRATTEVTREHAFDD